MKEKEPQKEEQYTAKCSVCPWEFWKGADRYSVMLMAEGHRRLTGHHVLVQGEFHTDPEPIDYEIQRTD